MNKDKYISEVNAVTAPDSLKEKIASLEAKPRKKHTARAVAAIAACLAVLVVAVPAFGSTMQTKSADRADGNMNGYSFSEDEAEIVESQSDSKYKTEAPSEPAQQADRKIIKYASVEITVQSIDRFTETVRAKLNAYGGYIGCESDSNYADSRSSNMTVHVPADRLESFLADIEAAGNVNSKNIGSDDVTNSYIDSEAKIKSLQTELDSLLKILEKADELEDVIKLQERISQVRGELDSYKSQLKALEGQIEYAKVDINASERLHTVKTDGSFGSQVKEKFLKSVYSIGDFFIEFAVTFVGSIPYILIIAAVAAVVIVIIKKREKKKEK